MYSIIHQYLSKHVFTTCISDTICVSTNPSIRLRPRALIDISEKRKQMFQRKAWEWIETVSNEQECMGYVRNENKEMH